MEKKQKNYNKKLRSQILIMSVRVEEAAGKAVKSLLRTVKFESKTLGNNSSSFSFKNRIDLLYDLEDLNKKDYTSCLKFAEIRNQFIHNPDCNSFKYLEKNYKPLLNYLTKNFQNELEDEELSLYHSFGNLWKKVLGCLLVLNIEYKKGYDDEIRRYVDSETIRQMDDIYSKALEAWSKEERKYPALLPDFSKDRSPEIINDFKYFLDSEIMQKAIEILDSIIENEITEKDIFKRKKDFIESLKKRKLEKD